MDYYNSERPGLGYELAAKVQKTFEWLGSFPEAWTRFSERSRRCVVSRKPYGVLYQIFPDCILVVATMDLRRDLKVWQDRAKGWTRHFGLEPAT